MDRLVLPPKPKRRNETQELTRPIEAALNAIPGVWAARNNTGLLPAKGAGGREIMMRFGLGIGSADIVGTVAVHTCTMPRGCNNPLHIRAIAFGLEVKWPNKRPTPEQHAWAEAQRRKGWIVATVHSISEAIAIVESIRV